MDMNEKRFYINFNSITMCYPCDISKRVSNFGVLEQYKDKKYTLKEINRIIADIIVNSPYINNSMFIKICVMSGVGYHHILDIKNYEYNNQERETEKEIVFMFDYSS